MSTLPQGGFGGQGGPGRRGRRRTIIIAAVVLLFVVVWSYGALTFGGDSSAERARSETAEPAPGGTPGGAATNEETVAELPDEPAYAEATTGTTDGDYGDSSTQERGTEQPADSPGSGAGSASGEPSSDESGPGEPHSHDAPEGATNEPHSYDPLGTGASPGDLAPVDEERLRYAAASYVSSAYGYSGTDKDDYNQAVGATVVWPDFYESQGAPEIQRYATQVGETGTKSAAVLTEFEIVETSADRVTGYAYFETGTGYDKNGNLQGRTQAYRQFMTLARSGATWKVYAVNEIEEVS